MVRDIQTSLLRPKKYCCFRKHGQKKIGSVGRFFYNGAYKYTKLLHTFLSLLSSIVTLYFDMFCNRKNDLDDDKQLELQ